MDRDIKIRLNKNGINKAIRELETYKKKRLQMKLWELIDVMCMDGEDYACEYMTHIDTGFTLESIMGYRKGNKGIIEAGGAAVWIEFGTGTIHNSGGDSFHPQRRAWGISDWGTYIWPHQKSRPPRPHGADPNGWYYPAGVDTDAKTGQEKTVYKFSQGMPMEPFMANTAERLRDEFNKTAKGVFSK